MTDDSRSRLRLTRLLPVFHHERESKGGAGRQPGCGLPSISPLGQGRTQRPENKEDFMQFVTIHGLAPNHLMGNGDDSDRLLREYIAGIVYGAPSRIVAVLLANGRFVALVRYEDDTVWAQGTFDRMGSFSYGAGYSLDSEVAHREFGTWIAHYSTPLDTREAGA